MAELALAFEVYLDAIGEEAERLAHAAASHFDEAVPSCPGWNGADLVSHITGVYRRWTTQVRAGFPDERRPTEELVTSGEEGITANFELAAADLIEALNEAGEHAPCWNFTGHDLDTGWVARRVAHESAIHRVDAELIAARPTRIDAELAADGLDERITVVLPVRLDKDAELGGSLGFVCDDIDAAFVVEVSAGSLRYRAQRGPADCVIVGSASAMFLFSWNRTSGVDLARTGDAEVAASWARLAS